MFPQKTNLKFRRAEKTFLRDDRGATSIEYALLTLLIGAGLIAALYDVRATLGGFFAAVTSVFG